MSNSCEEFVAALATGGPIRRWQALRHAARCPRCAAARDELRQIAEVIADVAPLTAAQRRLWAAAAGDKTTTAPLWASWFRPTLAAVFVGALAVWWALRPVNRQQRPPSVADVIPPAVREGTSRDVEGLRNRVVALGQELDELRERANLLDARKDVDTLMARLAPRGGSSGL